MDAVQEASLQAIEAAKEGLKGDWIAMASEIIKISSHAAAAAAECNKVVPKKNSIVANTLNFGMVDKAICIAKCLHDDKNATGFYQIDKVACTAKCVSNSKVTTQLEFNPDALAKCITAATEAGAQAIAAVKEAMAQDWLAMIAEVVKITSKTAEAVVQCKNVNPQA